MWKPLFRPGYFGRKRDVIVADLNMQFGKDNWRLVWVVENADGKQQAHDFEAACILFYETSYVEWLKKNPADLDFICSFGECIDNSPTNVESGLDYTKQEAFSTHIQDIAMRNALLALGRKFAGSPDKILTIRSQDSNGFRYGPGNIPFVSPELIHQPSKKPRWASDGTVEDFWQSNKWVQVLVAE